MLSVIASFLLFRSVFADFSWAPPGPALSWTVQPGPVAEIPTWSQWFSDNGGTLSVAPDITSCESDNDVTVWGATFDDGPGEYTGPVLDYFKKVNMHASFWQVGSNVALYPELTLRAYQEGHQIGLHTYTHNDLKTLSDDQVIAELVYSARAILEVTGLTPKYFRAPYGSIDDRVRNLAATMGLHSVLWNQDSNDWTFIDTPNIQSVPDTFQAWMDQGLTRAISLEHDLYEQTASVIAQNMDILIQNGKKIVPVNTCIGDANPYDNPTLAKFFSSGQFEQGLGINGSAAAVLIVKPSSSLSKNATATSPVNVTLPSNTTAVGNIIISPNSTSPVNATANGGISGAAVTSQMQSQGSSAVNPLWIVLGVLLFGAFSVASVSVIYLRKKRNAQHKIVTRTTGSGPFIAVNSSVV